MSIQPMSPVETRTRDLAQQAKDLPVVFRFLLAHIILAGMEADVRTIGQGMSAFLDVAGIVGIPTPAPAPQQQEPAHALNENPMFDSIPRHPLDGGIAPNTIGAIH